MEFLGEVESIWRYPVKSLAAQSLRETRIEPDGIPGDRACALFVTSEHARSGKPYRGKEHNLLHTADDSRKAVALAAERGVAVSPRSEPNTRYFDAAPISLIFDRWIDEVSSALRVMLDPLRWRPNLFARAADDFNLREPQLVGKSIELGEAILRVRSTIERCVTTTYDIQTGESNNEVLLYVAQQRASVLGVYCDVELAGTVRAGDALRLRAR